MLLLSSFPKTKYYEKVFSETFAKYIKNESGNEIIFIFYTIYIIFYNFIFIQFYIIYST